MKFKIAIIAFVLLFIQSCIPSLHPLWTQDKLIYEEKLLGTWEQQDADLLSVWNFSGGLDQNTRLAKGYELLYKEGKSEAKFDIHLVKLGEYLFFDIFPDEVDYLKFEGKSLAVPSSSFGIVKNDSKQPDIELNSLYFQHLLPVHTFAKVEIEKDEVRIFRFDAEWLDKLFKERKVRIKHETTEDGQVILTAPSADLQKFFEKYAADEKAYLEPIILKRNPN